MNWRLSVPPHFVITSHFEYVSHFVTKFLVLSRQKRLDFIFNFEPCKWEEKHVAYLAPVTSLGHNFALSKSRQVSNLSRQRYKTHGEKTVRETLIYPGSFEGTDSVWYLHRLEHYWVDSECMAFHCQRHGNKRSTAWLISKPFNFCRHRSGVLIREISKTLACQKLLSNSNFLCMYV